MKQENMYIIINNKITLNDADKDQRDLIIEMYILSKTKKPRHTEINK